MTVTEEVAFGLMSRTLVLILGIRKLYGRSMFGIRSRLLNVAKVLHYHSVKDSACYIMQNCSYGGKFKTWLRFDDLRYRIIC